MTLRISTVLLSLLFMIGCIQEGDGRMTTNNNAMTEEEMQSLKDWSLYWNREGGGINNLGNMMNVDFIPAPRDVNLQTIERFVFTEIADWQVNRGFILDKMHDRTYFCDNFAFGFLTLAHFRYPSEFQEQDLTRLIQAIEESNMLNWNSHYQGRSQPTNIEGDLSRHWTLGILFSDGTMFRSSGTGIEFRNDFFPPQHEWQILTDFISEIGAEVQERHHAEQGAQNE